MKKETRTVDKSNWTILRKAQEDYLRKMLGGVPDSSTLLDVGCGPSPFRDLTDRFISTSVDWEKYELVDKVVNLDDDLPFPDGSFDVVLSTNTFEHLYDAKKSINESYRVLKSNGLLVGVVPFLLRTHQEPHDYCRYTNFWLERTMKEAGLTDIVIRPLGTPFDVVLQMESHLFMKLFASGKKYILVKIAWNLLKIFNFIFKPVLMSCGLEKNMCLGYGFSGIKIGNAGK